MQQLRWSYLRYRQDFFHHLLIAVVAIGSLLVTAISRADDGKQSPQPPSGGSEQAQEQPEERSAGNPEKTQGKASDLTQLTLEQLLQIEITPINVLGSHTHLKGEWMVGYRYMEMDMSGNLNGTHKESIPDVLRQYPVAHTKMTMQMHMLEVMYAPTDDLTLMVMTPYTQMSMDHLNRTGLRYTTVSEGLGDIRVMGLYTFHGNARKGGNRFLFNAGLSFPTGSTDERHDTPTRRNAKLEYPMQLGSGTFDLLPGITYLGESKDWAWGAQTIGTIRLGKNDNGYRFGNEFRLNAWGVYKVTDWFAPSLRLDGHRWGNVHGADPEMDPTTNAAFDPKKQKGRRLDLLLGVNLYAPKGKLKGHRLTIEGGWPIYQSLKGPQLRTSRLWSVGWSYTLRH